jgi:ketosteroid isomerase-like protein
MRWLAALAVVGLSSTAGWAQRGLDEQQIRAARAEFNAAIVRHDMPAILSFLEEEFRVSASSGEFFNSRQEMGNAFAARFAEFRTGGRYAAYWRKSNGRWLLHAELYVPLFCGGTGCK